MSSGEGFRFSCQNNSSVSRPDAVKSISAPSSSREERGRNLRGIQLLPIAAFIKHFVSHCHNTNFPCSRTKGAQSSEQLSPAVDILSANLLKDDRAAHRLQNTQEAPLQRTAGLYPGLSEKQTACPWLRDSVLARGAF